MAVEIIPQFSFLCSPDSLANVEVQWAKEVKHFCKGVPVILVGNKIDLRGDQNMVANLARKDQVRDEPSNTIKNFEYK